MPVVLAIVGSAPRDAQAAVTVRTFNAGANGDILDPTQYVGGAAPVNGDSVTVNTGANSTINYNSSLTSLTTLALNNTSSAGTLDIFNQTSGALSIASLQLSNPSSAGTGTANGLYQITGGTTTVGTLLQFGIGSASGINISSGGTFNLNATTQSVLMGNASSAVATLNVTGAGSSFNLFNASNSTGAAANFAVGTATGGSASVNVTNGAVFNAYTGAFYIGLQQASGSMVVSNATANFNLATGSFTIARLGATGLLTVNGTGVVNVNAPQIQFGNGTPGSTTLAATGTLNLNDSAAFNGTAAATMFLGASNGGTGVINVNGNSTLAVHLIGYGGIVLSNGNGIVNLNGGTITASNIYRNTNSSVAASATTQLFNANGGSVVANASTGIFFDRLNVTLLDGGLTFNTGSNAIGITAAAMNGSGGLIKVGPGTLSIGVSTGYAGNTVVSQGTLLANSSTGSSTGAGTVTVANGATLGGGSKLVPGLISGSVNVSSGATISAGTATAIGNLSTGSQNWVAGGTFAVKVAAGTVGSADMASGDVLSLSGLTVDTSAGGSFNISLASLGSTAFVTGGSQLVIARDLTGTAGEFTNLINSNRLVLTATTGVTSDVPLTLDEIDVGGIPELVITAAPEPTTLALLGFPTAALALRRRRQRFHRGNV